MNRRSIHILIFTGFGCCSGFSLSADVEDIYELSLAELINLEVSVTSNYKQTLGNTPGTVRVIDQQSIARNGWQSLQQILIHIPGVQVSVSKNGHSNIWMRGVQSRNNNKLLLLVDGVPQNDGYYGNFDVSQQLPVQQIERLEVLSGPGGVVHGANSFAGVIAITSRSQGKRIGARMGSQRSATSARGDESVSDGQVYGEYDWQADIGNFYVYADTLEQQGFQPQYNRQGEYYDRDVDVSRQYLLAKYQTQSLQLKLDYSDYEYPYRYTKSNRWQGYEKQLFSAAVDYQQPVGDSMTLNLSAFYKQYDFRRPKTSYDGDRVEADGESLHDSAEQGVDMVLLWPVSAQRHVSVGLSYHHDWARDSFERNSDYPPLGTPVTVKENSLVEEPSRRDSAVFGEFQQQIWSHHWLHVGLRYDSLSDFDDQSSFRLGLTRETDAYFYKLLYGSSFRVPNYRDYLKKYSDEYSEKNPLQPEQMETLELALGFTPGDHEFMLTGYINHYKDFIKELTVTSVDGIEIDEEGDEYGFNFDEIEVMGIELSWNWQASARFSLASSLSFLIDASEDPGQLNQHVVSPEPISTEHADLDFLSDLTASLQFNYQLSNRYSVYMDFIYYSDRDVPGSYQQDSAVRDSSNANAFWLSNSYLRAQFSPSFSAGLALNNVFDRDIYSPAVDPASDYDNEWPGRHLELSVEWSF